MLNRFGEESARLKVSSLQIQFLFEFEEIFGMVFLLWGIIWKNFHKFLTSITVLRKLLYNLKSDFNYGKQCFMIVWQFFFSIVWHFLCLYNSLKNCYIHWNYFQNDIKFMLGTISKFPIDINFLNFLTIFFTKFWQV